MCLHRVANVECFEGHGGTDEAFDVIRSHAGISNQIIGIAVLGLGCTSPKTSLDTSNVDSTLNGLDGTECVNTFEPTQA